MWQLRAELRSVATDLEGVVRDRLAGDPHSNDARRAKAALTAMQTTLRWLEDNRYGLMRFEMHRSLEHAHRHAFELLTVLDRSATRPKRTSGWDGVERRQGGDRRKNGDRRSGPRHPWDRRIADRRRAEEPSRERRTAAG